MKEFDFLSDLEDEVDRKFNTDLGNDYNEGYDEGLEFAKTLFLKTFNVTEE